MLLGVISDIHEDIIALEKALTFLEKRNCDQIICLGDIVGYANDLDGFIIGGHNHLETFGYIEQNIDDTDKWIDCPHLSSGTKDNGLIMIDLPTMMIEGIAMEKI